MSTTQNTQILEDSFADFQGFLSEKKWSDAEALIDSLGEQGFEDAARTLHQHLNAAKVGHLLENDPLELTEEQLAKEDLLERRANEDNS